MIVSGQLQQSLQHPTTHYMYSNQHLIRSTTTTTSTLMSSAGCLCSANTTTTSFFCTACQKSKTSTIASTTSQIIQPYEMAVAAQRFVVYGVPTAPAAVSADRNVATQTSTYSNSSIRNYYNNNNSYGLGSLSAVLSTSNLALACCDQSQTATYYFQVGKGMMMGDVQIQQQQQQQQFVQLSQQPPPTTTLTRVPQAVSAMVQQRSYREFKKPIRVIVHIRFSANHRRHHRKYWKHQQQQQAATNNSSLPPLMVSILPSSSASNALQHASTASAASTIPSSFVSVPKEFEEIPVSELLLRIEDAIHAQLTDSSNAFTQVFTKQSKHLLQREQQQPKSLKLITQESISSPSTTAAESLTNQDNNNNNNSNIDSVVITSISYPARDETKCMSEPIVNVNQLHSKNSNSKNIACLRIHNLDHIVVTVRLANSAASTSILNSNNNNNNNIVSIPTDSASFSLSTPTAIEAIAATIEDLGINFIKKQANHASNQIASLWSNSDASNYSQCNNNNNINHRKKSQTNNQINQESLLQRSINHATARNSSTDVNDNTSYFDSASDSTPTTRRQQQQQQQQQSQDSEIKQQKLRKNLNEFQNQEPELVKKTKKNQEKQLEATDLSFESFSNELKTSLELKASSNSNNQIIQTDFIGSDCELISDFLKSIESHSKPEQKKHIKDSSTIELNLSETSKQTRRQQATEKLLQNRNANLKFIYDDLAFLLQEQQQQANETLLRFLTSIPKEDKQELLNLCKLLFVYSKNARFSSRTLARVVEDMTNQMQTTSKWNSQHNRTSSKKEYIESLLKNLICIFPEWMRVVPSTDHYGSLLKISNSIKFKHISSVLRC